MSSAPQKQWVDWDELSRWLPISNRHARRLVTDGAFPKRYRKQWDLHGCVTAYIRQLQGLVRQGGNGEHPVDPDQDLSDPDKLPVELQLKYWQAVRQRQQAMDHIDELAEQAAEEYRKQAAAAAETIRAAIAAAGLSDEQLAAVRDAVTKALVETP